MPDGGRHGIVCAHRVTVTALNFFFKKNKKITHALHTRSLVAFGWPVRTTTRSPLSNGPPASPGRLVGRGTAGGSVAASSTLAAAADSGVAVADRFLQSCQERHINRDRLKPSKRVWWAAHFFGKLASMSTPLAFSA